MFGLISTLRLKCSIVVQKKSSPEAKLDWKICFLTSEHVHLVERLLGCIKWPYQNQKSCVIPVFGGKDLEGTTQERVNDLFQP